MTTITLPSNAVLMIIDFQQAIDHPSWGTRNNPDAEKNAATLLNLWRKSGRPIFHIRHNSLDPNSYYRPGQPGNDFKSEVMPLPSEVIITKQTNSAFIGTDLEARLRAANYTTLVIVGVITNNSVEATVRMAGNLGFKTYLVSDATFTFDRVDWGGRHCTAEEVYNMSLANLNEEYCTVVDTASVLKMAHG
jgi:nicotinamidase-related amidase